MSSFKRIRREVAQRMIQSFIQLFEDFADEVHAAGSFRRGKDTIGDVEVVIRAESAEPVLIRADDLINQRVITKATYGTTASHRWGDTYRGCLYQGVVFEIFLATKHNWGNTLWLRTGPGDGNQYVMQQLIKHRWPVRFKDGQLHHVQYHGDGDNYETVAALNVPDEFTFFTLIGMPYIVPSERDINRYRQYLGTTKHMPDVAYIRSLYRNEPRQLKLF